MASRRTLVALVLAATIAAGGAAPAAASSWTLQHSPLKTALLGVASGGPRSTWAFGFGAERWTASGWQVSPTPGLRGDLWDGVALGPSRMWAVGQSPVGGSGHGLIMERSGGAWHRIAGLAAVSGLRSIARVPGTSRLWAAGWKGVGGTSAPLIEHKAGAGWQAASLPPGSGILNGIAAGRGETFAVGSSSSGALALRRTSAGWTRTPIPHGAGASLLGVAHVPGTVRFIAVGFRSGGGNHHPVAYLWDGARWSGMAIDVSGRVGELDGVVSIRRGLAWAVGTTGPQLHTLAERWLMGPTWRRVPTPTPSGTCGLTLHSVTAVPGTPGPTLWAAGDDGCGFTTTERYR
ncbi:MAG TPA: hypothetical protein VFW14_06355 [Gaiellales bacterium]|nr:hypothetical protein [Gaiellales bacterium]